MLCFPLLFVFFFITLIEVISRNVLLVSVFCSTVTWLIVQKYLDPSINRRTSKDTSKSQVINYFILIFHYTIKVIKDSYEKITPFL